MQTPQLARSGSERPLYRVLLWLVVAVAFISLLVDLRVLPGDGALGQDFNDFYVAATAQQQGLNPYDGAVLTGVEERLFGHASFSNTVASPPAFFVLFSPLTRFTPRQGYLIWSALSVLLFALAVRSLGRTLGVERDPLLWLIALSPPMIIGLFLGQVSLLLTACFLWAIGCSRSRRPIVAGLLLALTMDKPHLMIVPVALLCGITWHTGGRITALVTALAAVLITLLAVPFSEPGALQQWFHALLTYGGTFDHWQPDLSSLAGIYLPFVPRLLGRAASLLCVLVGLLATIWILLQIGNRTDHTDDGPWWSTLGFGTAVWLVLLPYIHPYDDTLLILPLAVVLTQRRHGKKTLEGAALLAVVVMLTVPELDLMGFRPNLTFSYTSLAVGATALALAGTQRFSARLKRPDARASADQAEAER